jgi:TatD DNase family protein
VKGPAYFDAHNHLQDTRCGPHLAEWISAARADGVRQVVVNGTRPQDWEAVARLAQEWPDWVVPSFGLHPWFIGERADDWEQQLEHWLDAVPAGVGEIGLDRWKADLPEADQEAVFLRQLAMAAERNLPVSIHCLRAWGHMVELLETHRIPRVGFLLHSYGGSYEVAERLLPLGAYFSFPGAFAREKKTRQQDVFKHLPADRILIETDAPDQMPPSALVRYKEIDTAGHPVNHPANLPAIYQYLAALRDTDLDAFAAQVAANFLRLFRA